MHTRTAPWQAKKIEKLAATSGFPPSMRQGAGVSDDGSGSAELLTVAQKLNARVSALEMANERSARQLEQSRHEAQRMQSAHETQVRQLSEEKRRLEAVVLEARRAKAAADDEAHKVADAQAIQRQQQQQTLVSARRERPESAGAAAEVLEQQQQQTSGELAQFYSALDAQEAMLDELRQRLYSSETGRVDEQQHFESVRREQNYQIARLEYVHASKHARPHARAHTHCRYMVTSSSDEKDAKIRNLEETVRILSLRGDMRLEVARLGNELSASAVACDKAKRESHFALEQLATTRRDCDELSELVHSLRQELVSSRSAPGVDQSVLGAMRLKSDEQVAGIEMSSGIPLPKKCLVAYLCRRNV